MFLRPSEPFSFRCTTVDSLPGGRNTSFMSRSETNTDPDAYPLYMLDEDYYDDNIELDEDSSSRPIDVDQEAKRAPLKTLGEDVGDFLTPQQVPSKLTTISTMMIYITSDECVAYYCAEYVEALTRRDG